MNLLSYYQQTQSGQPQITQKPNSSQPAPSIQKDRSNKPLITAHFDGLVDIVESEGHPAFLIKENGLPKVLSQIELDGKIYIPPPKDQILWLLPRAEKVLEYCRGFKKADEEIINSALFEDLIYYHKGISELPNNSYYVLLAAWVMHTYLMESFYYSPILLFYAVPERGKSRTGKGLTYVSYRGIHTETINEANLFRWSENHRASLFLDVRDLWQKAEKRGADDILLSRIEKGCKVSRVLWPERGAFRDTVNYDVFGPTIIATNEAIHHILDTRCISITMSDSSRKFEDPVISEWALPLKERLVEFRFRNMDQGLPVLLKPAHGRLGDILKPLYQIVYLVSDKRVDEFMFLVKRIEEGRMLDKSQGLEAQLIQIVEQLDRKVINGYLSIMAVTELYNRDKSERQKITPQRIGRKLKALGFDGGRTGEGSAAICYDRYKIEQLMETYGLPLTSETPETTQHISF